MRRNPNPQNTPEPIADYRHAEATRKNIPPAGLAAQGRVRESPKLRYEYDPHLPPVLRFDHTGQSDRLPELLETARQRALTADETRLLSDALRNRQPWLEWAGKREAKACEVDPVALHIHERVSAQAILRVAARQDVPRTLFADPEQEYREAVQFYQHDIEWSNRLILGDSLAVMASLARREDLAGRVQMIYIDPPYGIRFASNFQTEVGRRDVKDRPEDLTRDPETVKAYRDTWTLGVHSWLAYLRDRLIAAKELLADSGSIFVQISDENLHRVRCLMEEVLGAHNFVACINFRTMMPLGSDKIESVYDYIIWFARDKEQMKYRNLTVSKAVGADSEFVFSDNGAGGFERLSSDEIENIEHTLEQRRVFKRSDLYSSGYTPSCTFPFEFQGQLVTPKGKSWRTNKTGVDRLIRADRLFRLGEKVYFKLYHADYSQTSLQNSWADTIAFSGKRYVVETTTTVVERCLLMTTDPGDLVLDPTCGSGTTAYVAEQWGRRWITIDTSRVAIAIARQRLLTSKFDYYRLKDDALGVSGGLRCKSVPHITLKTIAQNQALDPIFAEWEPILAEKLCWLNACLAEVTSALRRELLVKLERKRQKRDRNDPVTDADERRWRLPEKAWEEWQVPFDSDPSWPVVLQDALKDYRAAWRSKSDAIRECISACAEQEELVDRPEVDRGVLRVSGPFTVEGVMPAEESLSLDAPSPIAGAPEEMETFVSAAYHPDGGIDSVPEPANAEAYIDKMLRLLRSDGVRFPDNKVMKFARLDPPETGGEVIHAEGCWVNGDGDRRVGVTFGPQYGPVTAKMVEETLRAAYRRGFDEIVFAAFTFDAAAQGAIQEDPNPQVRAHIAHIRPDVNMGDLLKDTPSSQLFTVSGLPRVYKETTESGEFVVTMEGVDIYDPVGNSIISTGASKVAAWFLDSDYDGRTFCVCQAFFPDPKAWDKLSRALTGVVDPDRFASFNGTRSLPFPVGKHARAAIKVIDPRGNEVMLVLRLDGSQDYA